MTCRHCGTAMAVYRTTPTSFEEKRRELRCPTCKRRAISVEKVVQWLAPVFIK